MLKKTVFLGRGSAPEKRKRELTKKNKIPEKKQNPVKGGSL